MQATNTKSYKLQDFLTAKLLLRHGDGISQISKPSEPMKHHDDCMPEAFRGEMQCFRGQTAPIQKPVLSGNHLHMVVGGGGGGHRREWSGSPAGEVGAVGGVQRLGVVLDGLDVLQQPWRQCACARSISLAPCSAHTLGLKSVVLLVDATHDWIGKCQ